MLISLLIILSAQNSLALAMGESEYLLEGEQIGSKLLNFDISGQKYYIYDIQNRKAEGLILIGPSNEIPDQDNIQKSLFIYFTSKYITDNQNKLKESYQKVYYDLETKSHSLSQQILNAFKEVPEQCFPIPKLEIISFCVKPTDKIEVMKVGSGIFRSKIIDWDTAFENYKKVGGEILAITDSPYTTYETIIEFYKDYKSSEIFLEKANLIDRYVIFKTNSILNSVSENSEKEFTYLSNRTLTLKNVESTKKSEANNLLDYIKVNLTEIAKKNGDISNINSNRKNIINTLNNINTEDNYYTSDIKALNDAIAQLNTLKVEIDQRLDNTITAYNLQGSFIRFIYGILGWFKTLQI